MEIRQQIEGEGNVHLQIIELNARLSETSSAGPILEPHSSSIEKSERSNADYVSPTRLMVRGSEKKLTLFALQLTVLEKATNRLGTLGFIWATVVLLGGSASTLDKTDFWFITTILLIEGARIFTRSHELEWQHQATWSIPDSRISSFREIRSSSHFIIQAASAIFQPADTVQKQSQHNREITESTHLASRNNWYQEKMPTRTWTSSAVPFLPYAQWVFPSRNVSKLLYWLQLASATTCVVLSLMKLIKQKYGDVEKGDTDKMNRHSDLNIFYALTLVEAALVLLEKAYWEWKVNYCILLEEVNEECELGSLGVVLIKGFFYNAYSRCINESIFEGLKMDMVSYSMDLLASRSPDEQLIGARVLRKFATSNRFSDDTLQKIGINLSVMERLLEMLNWKDPQEEEIRESAAEILSKLAGKKQNSLRIARIPGAIESISCLLHKSRSSGNAADEIGEKNIICDNENYGFRTFDNLGLFILEKLACDRDNCAKIGNTRGLLPKIIDFTHAGERLLTDETVSQSQILTVKRSLKVTKILVNATDTTGKQLRKEISKVVFTISNIRDILRYGEKHWVLQKLGIEILTSLALEEDASERIGDTGGVLKELFNISFKQRMPENQNHVKIVAGEALAVLTLKSKSNCHRILKLNETEKVINALEAPLLRITAARILRNLCTYSGADFFVQLRGVTAMAPTVLKAIMSKENKLQEVMVGLAAHVLRFVTSQEVSIVFERAGIEEAELASTLVQILEKYQYPSTKISKIRRFAIELAIWMMRDKETNIKIFKDLGMEKELEYIMGTTSELESFDIISGTVELSRHSTTFHSLIETAIQLLADK